MTVDKHWVTVVLAVLTMALAGDPHLEIQQGQLARFKYNHKLVGYAERRVSNRKVFWESHKFFWLDHKFGKVQSSCRGRQAKLERLCLAEFRRASVVHLR